jgi:hypothetical protein
VIGSPVPETTYGGAKTWTTNYVGSGSACWEWQVDLGNGDWVKRRRDLNRKASFVGGFNLWRVDRPGVFARFTWPLGKLEMRDDSFVLTARGPIRLLLRPTVVKYSELSEIIYWPSRLASMIEFCSTRRDVDGAFFLTMNSNFRDLVEGFRSHGVSVT